MTITEPKRTVCVAYPKGEAHGALLIAGYCLECRGEVPACGGSARMDESGNWVSSEPSLYCPHCGAMVMGLVEVQHDNT